MNSNINFNFFQINDIVYVANTLNGYVPGRIIDVTTEYLEVELFSTVLNQTISRVSLVILF